MIAVREFRDRSGADIQTQPRQAVSLIRTVARKAVIGKDRANLTIEVGSSDALGFRRGNGETNADNHADGGNGKERQNRSLYRRHIQKS